MSASFDCALTLVCVCVNQYVVCMRACVCVCARACVEWGLCVCVCVEWGGGLCTWLFQRERTQPITSFSAETLHLHCLEILLIFA